MLNNQVSKVYYALVHGDFRKVCKEGSTIKPQQSADKEPEEEKKESEDGDGTAKEAI